MCALYDIVTFASLGRRIYAIYAISCEYSNPMSRARTSTDGVAPLGDSVLIDALLLGRCDFLVKSKSAVSEFAIYFSPRLHNASYDFELNGQPLPVDAWWTSRARTG